MFIGLPKVLYARSPACKCLAKPKSINLIVAFNIFLFFLSSSLSKLTKINIQEASKNIVGSRIRINSKQNQSIWAIFETEEENLDDISSEMYEIPPENDNMAKTNNYIKDEEDKDRKKGDTIDKRTDIKKEFLEAFETMNDDFIFIEAKLIPIVPGDDPAVINKVSEDNF